MFLDGIGIGFEKCWYRKRYRYRFRKKLVSKKVSDSVSKNSGIEKSIGIGIGNNLVSKKVSDSVSEKIGIGKKFRIRFRSDFWYRHTLPVSLYGNWSTSFHSSSSSNDGMTSE